MKTSEKWLKEFVAVKADAADMGKRLGFAGIEVASVSPALPDFTDVRVGRIESLSAHPSADKLRVCQVDAGTGKLPDGTVIKAAALRGVDSSGMLCSARELGLSEEASGLMALADDAPLGTARYAVMGSRTSANVLPEASTRES